MFVAWLAVIGGRLESRYRFSKSIVHNTFPLPDKLSPEQRESVIGTGEAIRRARRNYPNATLAELYNPLGVPPDLVEAHRTNDRAVDQLLSRSTLASNTDRLAVLLVEYQRLLAP